jgi:hypothetical protein
MVKKWYIYHLNRWTKIDHDWYQIPFIKTMYTQNQLLLILNKTIIKSNIKEWKNIFILKKKNKIKLISNFIIYNFYNL